MYRSPNSPKKVSLWQLVEKGYIDDSVISVNGRVNAIHLKNAEEAYLRNEIEPQTRPPPKPVQTKGQQCCVCLSKEKTYAFAPCFHMCMCGDCSKRVNRCPICRTPAQGRHRIWS